MSNQIHIEKKDRVMIVTIDRPEKKNALSHPMYSAMADALSEYEESPELRALLFTGRGDTFTAGNDLQAGFAFPAGDETPPPKRFLEALPAATKPLLAAVNGSAIGVGLTMLLHCDVVFAAETADFRAPFVRLGVVPEAGSSMLLPAAVGMAMANDILLAGRVLSASEAQAAGLVSRVLPNDELLATALDVARNIASAAPQAVRYSKALIRNNQQQITAHMDAELELFSKQVASSEFAECAQAFVQKRKPVFP